MANGTITPPSPVKDTIDSNSGRFEFLKQALTLGLAGIAGVAALFTDSSRVPADTFSKWTIFGSAIGLALVVAFAIMGLSTYANLLTATASSDTRLQSRISVYANGVRNHGQVVMIGLMISFVCVAGFAVHQLFFISPTGTPESAIDAAQKFASKAAQQPPGSLSFRHMESDNDAYVVTYLVPATNSEISVRLSKKDGSIIQVKAAPKP
jgi:hypothetical protein